MKKYIVPFTILAILLLAGAGELYAQTSPPPPPPPPGCWPPPCNTIPIDGGIGFLAAAAIAFGAKKLFDNRKKVD